MNLKKPGWMSDHRLIADDAMEIIRHIAVATIVERNKRPDDVSDMIGLLALIINPPKTKYSAQL